MSTFTWDRRIPLCCLSSNCLSISLNTKRGGIDPRQHGSTRYIPQKRVWRLRIGDYRAFFDVVGDEVKFLTILPREKAYRRVRG